MLNSLPIERRARSRSRVDGVVVSVRRKGRLGKLQGVASDFSPHGLAVFLDQPLPKDAQVFVSVFADEHRVENILSVVHNCVAFEHGYRCGIAFRTGSQLQMDRDSVQHAIEQLHAFFLASAAAREELVEP